MKLYPVPHHLQAGNRRFDYSGKHWVLLPENASFRLKNAARAFVRSLANAFVPAPALQAGIPSAGEALVTMREDLSVDGKESYRLSASPDGFTLTASGDAGFYYGLLTIEQLLSEGSTRVPECLIADAPDLRQRGYMLDVSRCKVPSMATVKEIVDSLSRLRYNELQLYMEHTFAFAADERVWFDNSPFSADEIMEIDQYCQERFIELVPNLNSFGHLERWLRFPEYQHLAESPTPWYFKDWDVYCQGVLAPGPEALAFIDRLYAEFLPNFTSRRINIGCDETVELGHGRSEKLCAERGATRVYLDFLLQLAAVAKRHGRDIQFWGDIIMHQPELIRELPQDITALEWGYEANHPFEADTAKFRDARVPFYVCPGTSSWNSLTGRTANMFGNIASAARHGANSGAAGMLMTDWGDGGHHQYWPLSWAGLTYAGLCAWNARAAEEAEALLPAALADAFAPEGGVELAGYLLDLGRVCEAFQYQPHNRTAFFCALFTPEWSATRDMLPQIRPEEIRAARRRLAAWRRRLAQQPPRVARLVLDELDNAAAMADCALLVLARLKGGRIDSAAWRDAMRHVIGRHSDLWLARNRVGGLNESSNQLRQALARG